MTAEMFKENITSRDNPLVRQLKQLCDSRADRYEQQAFVTEGIKLCSEAASAGLVKVLLATDAAIKKYSEELAAIAANCGRNIVISESIAAKISDVKSPQGVFCLCDMLDNRNFADKIDYMDHNGKYVLLCSLQDPGNIGTIIRCCDAFGVTAVVLTKDCPDIYSPKLLRSTMGSLFHLPVMIGGEGEEVVCGLRDAGIKLYAAALSDNSIPLGRVNFEKGSAVVIGNEGKGLPQKIIELCHETVKIEMRGRAESLNAAAAASILTYKLMEER
ncbi:MAG: RNA methyltransferase [Oscillospiraceae bacterium]|nr:RNA methyltransferase [Oscillospiraceae bacterium]MBQ9938347.1 RNA methyltransferase [Oscillospiraceae bacterium]